MTATMLSIQALSPIHVGTGQGAGVIDLPLIREAVTGWPYLPGSSIKGVLRDACQFHIEGLTDQGEKERYEALLKDTFGPDTNNASDHAGGVIFGDQHLLCLPVRLYVGGFAWVTCPFAFNRWLRDQQSVGVSTSGTPLKAPNNPDQIVLAEQSALAPTSNAERDAAVGPVYLEDLQLSVHAARVKNAPVAIASLAIASEWRDFFIQHFGIVSDTTFGFLARTAMEVTARNSIDDARKVVKGTALWWEESTPSETIFAGPLIATPQARDAASPAAAMLGLIRAGTTGKTLQIGGNATVGRGLVVARLPQDGGAS